MCHVRQFNIECGEHMYTKINHCQRIHYFFLDTHSIVCEISGERNVQRSPVRAFMYRCNCRYFAEFYFMFFFFVSWLPLMMMLLLPFCFVCLCAILYFDMCVAILIACVTCLTIRNILGAKQQ